MEAIFTAYYKTRNTGTRNNGTRGTGTPQNSAGTTEHYPENQQNTPEQQNHTKRGTIAVLLRENLKVFIADINYLFFYFSLFKVGLHVVKIFF